MVSCLKWLPKTCQNEWIIPEEIQAGDRVGHGISSGIEERSCRNSRSQLKNNFNLYVEFPGVFTKNSCGLSMCLGFSPCNFHQEVSQSFAKFSGVKVCF